MKATDLMINDWIEWMGNKCKVDLPLLMTEYQDNVDSEYVKPIPLTAEILKKNGWNSPMYDGDSYYHKDVFPIYYRNDCYKIRYIDRAKINYVHELQHALRLCGLGEFANNFKI